MLRDILLAFIPIFVTVDAIGTLPIYVTLTEGLDAAQKRRVIFQSVLTALCLAIGFIFLGKWIFQFLGITMGDFMIAGGLVLFCIAIIDLLQPDKQRRIPLEELGAVPIGTPLMVGPAVLTTTLMMRDAYGLAPSLIAILINVFLAGWIFLSASTFMKLLGRAGSRALSRVMALLLIAIAVMMVRKGIMQILVLP